jgi:endoglucanase
LNDVCQELIFINANDDVYLGYAGWAAGSFSATTYNLTETPFSITAGNTTTFTDQQMVTQCIAGTRQGGGIASKHKRTVVVAGIATEHKKAVRKSM